MEGQHKRYSGGAIIFHWVIALLIMANLPIGWVMGSKYIDKELGFALFQLHKTLGLSVLLLTAGRLIWRVMNPPPPFPETMKLWERTLSHIVHLAFYGIMVALPLLGWMMVSASPTGIPTFLFGLIDWPHIGPLAQLALAEKESAYALFGAGHELLALLTVALLVLHVGGALKHQLVDRQPSLARIISGRLSPPATPARGKPLALGAVVGLFMLVMVIGFVGAPSSSRGGSDAASLDADVPTTKIAVGDWIVDPAVSSITFAGQHADNKFQGRFEQWTASIFFDPDDLAEARVLVNIDTGSAVTGDSYYDSTLQSADWFSTAKHPAATFVSTAFRQTGSDSFEVDGDLAIRGLSRPITFPFTLRTDGGQAQMNAALTINRLDYDIGKAADAKAEWVSNPITITLTVQANKKTE